MERKGEKKGKEVKRSGEDEELWRGGEVEAKRRNREKEKE